MNGLVSKMRPVSANGAGAIGAMMPGRILTHTWKTWAGPTSPTFYRYDSPSGGRTRIVVQSGTTGKISSHSPYRPVSIPKRWNAKSMSRVERALKGQQKTAIRIIRLTGGEASATKRARVVTPKHGHRTVVEAT